MNETLDTRLAAIANDPQHRLASLSVLAIRDGRVVYEKQFGTRRIDNTDAAKNKPANAQTMYRIGSISKLVVTLGVLRLVEEGKLALDKDIGDYLGYRVRNPQYPDTPITLRLLVSHTSSLRDDGGYFWPTTMALSEVLVPGGKRYGEGRMWATNAAPGAYFAYCNLNWGVIGTVMERATGERFDRLMTRLVLAPLGLHGGFNPAAFAPTDLDNLATIYRKAREVGDKDTWDPAGPWVPQVDDYSEKPPMERTDASYVIGTDGTRYGPQGNLRVSAADLGRVMRMLMNGGELDGKPFLKPITIDEMLAIEWRRDAASSNGATSFGVHKQQMNAWGLGNHIFLDLSGAGWGDRLVEGGGFTANGHLGEAYGLTGAFVFDRKTRIGMIYLIGGTAFDPDGYMGEYSGLYRYEEKILTTLYNHAIEGAGR